MASKSLFHCEILSILIIIAVHLQTTMANDSDILHDYILPPNTTFLDATFFTNQAGRFLVGDPNPTKFNTTTFGMEEFPALRGQGVSLEVVQVPAGTGSPLHFHPRSAEIILLLRGSLNVGFIDSKNRLFNQTLYGGDVFLFPKGLVHYAHNSDPKEIAVCIAAYGSANPGVVSLPNNLFNTGIDNALLAQIFKIDMDIIKKIKENLAKDT